MRFIFTKVGDWYTRFERPISSLSFIGGFIFDSLTLRRVDLFWENFFVVTRLVAAAVCIILINLLEHQNREGKNTSRLHFWYINILQFLFGGLLGTFLVFYFRSTTLLVTWPFLFLLLVAAVANEVLKKHYARLVFRISFFYLALLSFSIFMVPILFHRIGTDVFLISGLVSLAILGLFLLGLRFFAREKFRSSRNFLASSIASIFIITNLLYFFNLIPPIPLSLKDGGIYHTLRRDTSGNYVVEGEERGWQKYFVPHETVHLVTGNSLYAYSAIFSPALFTTPIIHEWQRYDGTTGEWVTIDRVPLSATGGRDGGYRTYSKKNYLMSGEWRVNVETGDKHTIGRLRFNIVVVDQPPVLTTYIKE